MCSQTASEYLFRARLDEADASRAIEFPEAALTSLWAGFYPMASDRLEQLNDILDDLRTSLVPSEPIEALLRVPEQRRRDSHASCLQSQLQAFDTNLQLLYRAQGTLKQLTDSYSRHRHHCYEALHVPISALPAEILSLIFRFVATSFEHANAFAGTSTLWRAVAMRSKGVHRWRAVRIDVSPHRFDRVVERISDFPDDTPVHIKVHDKTSDSPPLRFTPHMLSRLVTPEIGNTRLGGSSILCPRSSAPETILLPMLRVLRIRDTSEDEPFSFGSHHLVDLSHLRMPHLELLHVYGCTNLGIRHCQALKTVTLINVLIDRFMLEALCDLSHLEMLRLVGGDINIIPTATNLDEGCEFRRLHNLRLEKFSLLSLEMFFLLVRAPALVSFALIKLGTDQISRGANALMHFVSPSYRALQVLIGADGH